MLEVGFQIEMAFEMRGDDGATFLDLSHGKIIKIVNEKRRIVLVELHKGCVAEGEPNKTRQQLHIQKWTSETVVKGA